MSLIFLLLCRTPYAVHPRNAKGTDRTLIASFLLVLLIALVFSKSLAASAPQKSQNMDVQPWKKRAEAGTERWHRHPSAPQVTRGCPFLVSPSPHAPARFLPGHEAAMAVAGPGDYQRNYSAGEERKMTEK